MKITLENINLNDKKILLDLLELYPHEIIDIEKYWKDDKYYPYFVKTQNEIVGFVLVNIVDNACNLSAIFIKNEYRRKGIGKNVMFQLFKNFVGTWEIKLIKNSKSAELFLENVIKEYTQNVYMRITGEKDDGPLFIVNTNKKRIKKILKGMAAFGAAMPKSSDVPKRVSTPVGHNL